MATKKANEMMIDGGFLANNFTTIGNGSGNNYRGNALAVSSTGQANSSLRKRYDDTYYCCNEFEILYPTFDFENGHLTGGQSSNQRLSEFQNSCLSNNPGGASIVGGEFQDKIAVNVDDNNPMTGLPNPTNGPGSNTIWWPERMVNGNLSDSSYVSLTAGADCVEIDLGADTYIWKVEVTNTSATFPITHVAIQSVTNANVNTNHGYYNNTFPQGTAISTYWTPNTCRYVRFNSLDGSGGSYVIFNEISLYGQYTVYTNNTNMRMG